MRYKNLLFTGFLALLIHVSWAQSQIKTGVWRGALATSSGNEIPFNFEVTDVAGKQQLVIY